MAPSNTKESAMERGKLVRWNEEKGFGFIQPSNKSQDVFLHITALKKMARKPIVGDEILFQREQQTDGKARAINASIEGVAVISGRIKSKNRPSTKQNDHYTYRRSGSALSRIITLAIILSIGSFAFNKYQEFSAKPIITNEDLKLVEPSQLQQTKPSFRCETGKYHCSQMRSCAEATFYINNCPGTKMDGDHDGIPCEQQWCR